LPLLLVIHPPASAHRTIGGRGRAFSARHLSSRPRRLPCEVVTLADADPAGAELEHPRAFAALDDPPAGGLAERVDGAPRSKREHAVAVITRGISRELPALAFGFGL
jgi:hypothetical protein